MAKTTAPKHTSHLSPGTAYNSSKTGDYYIYVGQARGLHVFVRPHTGDVHRLHDDEMRRCFDPAKPSLSPADPGESAAAVALLGDYQLEI